MLLLRGLPGLFLLLACLPGCRSTNPWAESYSPTSFRSGYPPVAAARVLNVGHVDPREVYERDFSDTTLVGTSVWTGYRAGEDRALDHARAVGADLVLVRKRFAATEHRTTYDAYPGWGSGRSSVLVQEADGRRTRVTADAGPDFVPRTRTQRRYTFQAVFLRTEAARDAGPMDGD